MIKNDRGLSGKAPDLDGTSKPMDAGTAMPAAAHGVTRPDETAEHTDRRRDFFWLYDPARHTLSYVSPGFADIFGKPENALYDDTGLWIESIHPEDRATIAPAFESTARTGCDQSLTYRVVRPDGGVRWLLDRSYVIADGRGGIDRIGGVVEDVTERRRAKEEDRKRQKYLESVLFHAPDAIAVMDPNHRVIDWNPGAVSMFGYSWREAVGKNLDDLVAGKDSRAEAVGVTRRVFTDFHVSPFETVRHRKDGTPIDVIAAGSAIAFDDEIQGVVAVYTDITALKRSEQALRESDEQMRSVFNTIPEPVSLVRMVDGAYVNVNESFVAVTGLSRERVIGKTAHELALWEDPACETHFLRVLKKRRAVFNYEARFNAANGRIVNGLISARILTIHNEPHYISTTRDITALKAAQAEQERLEAQLQQAQKMEAIGTLAGGIAHDFNNLLMGIQGRNSLMMADMRDDNLFQEHLHEIEEYVRRATELARQLLGFARRGKYEVAVLDPNTLVKESLALFGRTHKEIDIGIDCDDSVVSIEADCGQMEQVLLNLYVNAWQAMPGGGRLTVSTRNAVLSGTQAQRHGLSAGTYVAVAVSDTGVGIDSAVQDKIFDPFFTTKGMGRGTGLGLASAYGIMKNHGGMISVASAKGQGACFTLYLPASDKIVEAKPVFDASCLMTGGETILLVDDEDMILDVGKAMLSKLGYTVLVAKGGEQGLQMFDAHQEAIDLVILDMIMPGMSGEAAFEKIKQIDPQAVILLSSGYSIDTQASSILAGGCCGFIQKPFSISQLSQKLRDILD